MIAEAVSLPERQMKALVEAGIFRDDREAANEAFCTLLTVRPNLKLEAAIQMFRNDEVSLLRAAELAGADFWTFQKILQDRGLSVEIECASPEEMDEAIAQVFEG
jgi:predicted HTH domain antitoxin